MAQIILDFGSGNTCKNDINYVKRMIDEMHAVNTGKHEVIIKWQLFQKAGKNIPLHWEVFNAAYTYAELMGYETTASVFDLESLDKLSIYEIPFVKIANNKDYYYLIDEIPRRIPVYVSVGSYKQETANFVNLKLCCVSNYPADVTDYLKNFYSIDLRRGISDHTKDWELFKTCKPRVYECHYKLDDSEGLDSGEFARTPSMLAEIL